MIEEQRAKRFVSLGFWGEMAILVLVAVVVAVVVRAFVMQTFFIPSPSMEHTLNIDDKVLVNKLVYGFRDPHRGEIIVFQPPSSWRVVAAEKDFIKRVIGVGGDHVVCCDAKGRVTVNGKALDESSYLYRGPDGTIDLPSEDPFDVVVPPGRLWVMGDHRSDSDDSRAKFQRTNDIDEATISTDDVVGRAFVLFWPASRARWLDVPSTFEDIPKPSKS